MQATPAPRQHSNCNKQKKKPPPSLNSFTSEESTLPIKNSFAELIKNHRQKLKTEKLQSTPARSELKFSDDELDGIISSQPHSDTGNQNETDQGDKLDIPSNTPFTQMINIFKNMPDEGPRDTTDYVSTQLPKRAKPLTSSMVSSGVLAPHFPFSPVPLDNIATLVDRERGEVLEVTEREVEKKISPFIKKCSSVERLSKFSFQKRDKR